mgnify:CR=1 FL=1
MRQLIISLIVIAGFVFTACSSDEELKKETGKQTDTELTNSSKLNIKFDKVYSWVNLMPGPKAYPRFHITGEYEISGSPNYSFENVKLSEINIFQNDTLIYNINPELRTNEQLSTDSSKYFIFSSKPGLEESSLLDRSKMVDAEFIFVDDTIKFKYDINDIKVEEAH